MFLMMSFKERQEQEAQAQRPFTALGAQVIANQLADLARVREAAMAMIAQITVPDPSPTAATPEQRALAFTRMARAMRQIIVLEQELLGLRTYSVRQYSGSQEQRANEARRIAGEALTDRGDTEPSERPDLRDGRDTNDLHEPDDIDDYDDNGDALRNVVLALNEVVAPSARGQGPVASHDTPEEMPKIGTPILASAAPHVPIRRRAMRGRGPPSG